MESQTGSHPGDIRRNNRDLAFRTLEKLTARGVREFCLCPGARNAPLVRLLDKAPNGLKVWGCFEERSAAFFALGRTRATGRPVAIVTTSGTAVANLLPAAIEAHYSGFPLVFLTADRPRYCRDSGAPQTIHQVGLFGPYVSHVFDWDSHAEVDLDAWSGSSSLQINLCFGEPLQDEPQPGDWFRGDDATPESEPPSGGRHLSRPLHKFFQSVKSPLVLLGALRPSEAERVKPWLLQLRAPIYAEAHSQLRGDLDLAPWLLRSGERLLRTKAAHNYFDGVIRIGGVPTLRFWRDLEDSRRDLPLLSVSDLPWRGLGRSVESPVSLAAVLSHDQFPGPVATHGSCDELLAIDRDVAAELLRLLALYPKSEPGLVHALSNLIGGDSLLFLGNSLPVREWDLAAHRNWSSKLSQVESNRGANGIDGLLSTFLGLSAATEGASTGGRSEAWAVIGDLSALYDLAALWMLPQVQAAGATPKLRIVVINNGGGMIFSRLFPQPAFQNQHQLTFQGWAQQFFCHYEEWQEVPVSWQGPAGPAVLEIRPDPTQTAGFWEKYESLWKV